MRTGIYGSSIMQNGFTARKIIPEAPPSHPSPDALATTGLFTVPIVLLFPECQSWDPRVWSPRRGLAVCRMIATTPWLYLGTGLGLLCAAGRMPLKLKVPASPPGPWTVRVLAARSA